MDRNLLNEIIEHYGQDNQIIKCIEECAELIKSLLDYRNQRLVTLYDVRQEIADVIIMAQQMSLIFGDEEVEKLVDYKLKRTEHRIKGVAE